MQYKFRFKSPNPTSFTNKITEFFFLKWVEIWGGANLCLTGSRRAGGQDSLVEVQRLGAVEHESSGERVGRTPTRLLLLLHDVANDRRSVISTEHVQKRNGTQLFDHTGCPVNL